MNYSHTMQTDNDAAVKAIFVRVIDGAPAFALSSDPRQDQDGIPDWVFCFDAAYCRQQFGKGWKRRIIKV